MDRIAKQVISSNQVLHNLSADESWTESIGAGTAFFSDIGSEELDTGEAITEEELREQQDKLDQDMKCLE